jgi:Domain of unknown function (DUF4260)
MSAVTQWSADGRSGAASPAVRGSRWVTRAAWLAVGAMALALAAGWMIRDELGATPLVLFLLMPDLAFVAGAGAHAERGQLAARAVPIYNAAHRTVGPVSVIVLALAGGLSTWWLVAGLAWLAHVALDRGFGFGLRTAEGWQRV